MPRPFKIAILVIFVSPFSIEASEQRPLLVRSQGVGQIFRLTPPVYGTFTSDSQSLHFDMSRTVANYWAHERKFLLDAEFVDDAAHLSWQHNKDLRFGVGFSTRRFAHTRTDQAAITFHETFFMGQDGRLEAGKDNLRFKIPDYNLEFTANDRDRKLSEQINLDFSLPIRWKLVEPLKMAWTAFGSYELARGGPYEYGSQDKGWQLNASYPFDEGQAFGSLTQVYFAQDVDERVPTAKQQLGGTLGYGHFLSSDKEVLGQMMIYQPVFRELGQLSRNSYEIHLAYRYTWEKYAFEATLIENIFWLYNTPDWGLCFGLRAAI